HESKCKSTDTGPRDTLDASIGGCRRSLASAGFRRLAEGSRDVSFWPIAVARPLRQRGEDDCGQTLVSGTPPGSVGTATYSVRACFMPSLRPDLVKRIERLPKPTNLVGAMQPLFEAISNAIHSTQEKFGDEVAQQGSIVVTVNTDRRKKNVWASVEDNG